MRYDLHAHSAEYSPCSAIAADELCRLATALGIDGIALTEHDLWWPPDELAALRSRYPGLALFGGMERSCREGHFLVFLPEGADPRGTLPPDTIQTLSPWIHDRGGLLIWAHPFRFESRRIPFWLGNVPIDGIEVTSSNMNLQLSDLAESVANEYGILPLSNSDAHDAESLGRYWNEFDTDLQTVEQLIDHVKNGSGSTTSIDPPGLNV
jgi:predicted metal-dependent phosphoesterase TrpH